MNQHYVSQVLLRRFKIPGQPLQRYRVKTEDWQPRNAERIFSARGWNQLRLYGQIDDSLEIEFSKIESGLPRTLKVLEEAAARSSSVDLEPDIHRNICQYCSFLHLTSPFAKAKAPVDFLGQVSHELESGKAELMRKLSFSEKIIQEFCRLRSQGYYPILQSDDSLQLVYRIQFRQLYPTDFQMFLQWTEWAICASPIEFPISDVALVQVHMRDQNAVFYVLPIGPSLLLRGKCEIGSHLHALPPVLRVGTLPPGGAEYWLDAICLSAVTELVSSQVISDIATIRYRAKSKGIRFVKIVNPDRGASIAMTEFDTNFGLRMVPKEEYVRYVHSFIEPAPG